MRENSERQHNSTGRHRILQTLAFLGAFTLAPGAKNVDASHHSEARAATKRTIEDCRDKVRCMLKLISIAYQKDFPELRDLKTTSTGKTIKLGGQSFELMESGAGYVLVDSDGHKYLATNDIENTIQNVNAFLAAPDNTIASR